MRGLLTARDVEAAAASGVARLDVDGRIVTPLARDRAVALGVVLGEETAAAATGDAGSCECARDAAGARLRLESRVRAAARQVLLRERGSTAGLEEAVAAVVARLWPCRCGGGQS